MRPSIKDVADKAGVSTATVSHVINNTRFVKEETRKKVLKAMEELDYHPNYAARSLRSQKSNIIALLVPDISNFFFTQIAREIETILRKKGYNLIVSNSNEQLENEIEQLKIFNSQLIDGLIMAPTANNHSYLKERLQNYPVVFVDRKPIGYSRGDCVLVDNIEGAYQATEYLIKSGHQRIGIITGLPGLTSTTERLMGYKKALIDNGIKINDDFIKIGDSRFDSGYNLTREIFSTTNITALFVTNNLMSIGAMSYLKKAGVKIPEEIAIIGFDDYEWASITDPPLSVVKQPTKEIGQKAAQLILKRINADREEHKEYRLKTKLIIRSSC